MTLGRIISLLGLAALIANPVLAEPPTGSRMGNRLKKVENFSKRDPYALAYRSARCAAALKSSAVRQVLDASTQASRSDARQKIGMLHNCSMAYFFGGEAEEIHYTMDQVILDGMYGEAVVMESKAGRDMPAMPVVADYNRPWFAVSGRNPVMNEVAVCISEIAPSKTFALFDTKIGSPEEMSAARALAPELGTCVPANVELVVEPRTLRSALGEAMYHRIYDRATAAAVIAGEGA